ncbi:hypothetical protein [Frigoriglobus tundricola]|nr:hypothetical protein [Frigoriglobus tundricola]
MEVFQELVVRGEPRQIVETAEFICKLVADKWSRDVLAEEQVNKWSPGVKTLCFDRSRDERLPGAALFLTQKTDALTVTNIVPRESGQLAYGEYNALLSEFIDRFVQPAVARTGAQMDVSDPQADLERWLTPGAAKKLRAFCAVANKRSGASHPSDRKFWFDFVVAAHREGAAFPASTLARWLNEVGGWDEEWASKLSIQYEQARGLLEYADHQAVGA